MFSNGFKALVLTTSVALLSLGVSGCYGAKVVSGARGNGTTIHDNGFSLFWGLTTTTTAAPCKNGLSFVKTYHPWWGFFISGLTLGIITPITKVYMCAAAGGMGYPAASGQPPATGQPPASGQPAPGQAPPTDMGGGGAPGYSPEPGPPPGSDPGAGGDDGSSPPPPTPAD